MFVSEEEARRRLEHEENCLRIPSAQDATKEEVIEPEVVTGEVAQRYGHGTGKPVDEGYRAFLGLMAQTDTIANVQEQFGSNNVTICKAKRGLNSSGNPAAGVGVMKDVKEQIADKVLDLMLAGVSGISVDEIQATPLVKRTGVLKDISSIHANMAPKASVTVTGKILTIMSPGVGKESDFMMLEVEASI